MRFSRFPLAAVAAVAVAFVSFLASRTLISVRAATPATPAQVAQPQTTQPAPPPPPPHTMAAPINLKVLPRNLTGEQVHEIMEQWEGELGSGCKTCHAADPKNLAPNGRPRLNFADDSKPEKQTARKMYLMVQDINKNYIAKIDSSGAPVTCGTCHRGHLGPELFAAAPEKEHDHDHEH
jgi:hypothetical protein